MTKLLQLYFVRQLASLAPYDKTGVVININCPGLCNTGLARHSASLLYRFQIRAMNAVIGRTPEQGARTIVYAATAGPESHGKFCTTCSVRE
jgi:NAD(P)-dependent dehydrogenase (short-subunit alcohol dehydrogenase family)